MQDCAETRKRQGPIAVLALLVGFLLAYAPAAHAELGRTGSALAEPGLAKAAKSVRSASRSDTHSDEADQLASAEPPRVHASSILLHAAAPGAPRHLVPAAGPDPLAYRARGPPAA